MRSADWFCSQRAVIVFERESDKMLFVLNRIRRHIGLNSKAAAMTDANAGLVKINKLEIKLNIAFIPISCRVM